jgi:hypothetical protein
MNEEYYSCDLLPTIRIGDRLEILFSCINLALFPYKDDYDFMAFLPGIIGDGKITEGTQAGFCTWLSKAKIRIVRRSGVNI